MKAAMAKIDADTLAKGREHGIHLADTAEAQNRDAYIDPLDTMPILQYKVYDVRAEMVETLKKCIEG